jgi:hypothetical protein
MSSRAKILTCVFLLAITICTSETRAQTFPSPTIEQLILQYFGISNTQTPIGVTDGNPQATTAVFASDAFNIYGMYPLLDKAPKGLMNHYAFRADVSYGELHTDVIDGDFYTLNLAQGWRFTDHVGLVYSIPLEYRDTEGAQVFIGGLNAGLPINILLERGKGLGWSVTPWAVGGVGVSDELDQGALVYGLGVTSSLTLSGKFLKLTMANQIGYEDGEPFEYDSFFNNEQAIHQTIAKNGIVASVKVGPAFADAGASYTNLLDGGFVDEYWSPDVGFGVKLGNGFLRAGYHGDIGNNYRATSIRLIFQFAL